MAKVKLEDVRLSYANLLTPRKIEEKDTPAYSVVLMIPKDTKAGKAAYALLRKAQEAAAAEGQEKHGGRFAKQYKDLVRDGDDESTVDPDKNPEYAGHWLVNTKNTRKPPVVDQKKMVLDSEDKVYSGMWANVIVNTFPYKHPTGGSGVSFSLQAVQKVRDDEPFGGGGVDIDDEFEELEIDEEEDDLLG